MNWLLIIVFSNGAIVEIPQDSYSDCVEVAMNLDEPANTNVGEDFTRQFGFDAYCVSSAGGTL